MLDITELNFIAILLAAVAKFLVGGLWFSKPLFAGIWLKEINLKMEDLGSPKNALLIGFALSLLISFSFAILLQMLALDLRSSLAVAVIIAIGITSAQVGLSFAFEGRSLKLFLIYATQSVAEFVAVVLVLTLM
ncbi:MAG: DUF1761 domain-containing protein [Emcibacteraceae bacterium]|nr:DUF1761 domain-containing protein [Emcibacteraceae bacterium]